MLGEALGANYEGHGNFPVGIFVLGGFPTKPTGHFMKQEGLSVAQGLRGGDPWGRGRGRALEGTERAPAMLTPLALSLPPPPAPPSLTPVPRSP